MKGNGSSYFLPRDLHPLAWWLWALCMAVAASRTTNPWLLALIIAVVCHVVVSRKADAPWAKAFRLYLYLAVAIVILRVAFRVLFGGAIGTTVLVHLPGLDLPHWAAGIQILGNITAENLLIGAYDGLRLATMLVCLGAANALANPKRLLKSMPSALYEVGTAVTVAISVFPQLAESVVRVRRARRLRGDAGGRMHGLRSVIVPVLADALDRSMHLAAAMDARGYGRRARADARAAAISGTLMLVGLIGICIGVYISLDATAPVTVTVPVLLIGCAAAGAGFLLAGRRVERSRYRPDPWRLAEAVTGVSGLATAALMIAGGAVASTGAGDVLHPSVIPLMWPQVSWMLFIGILAGILPSFLTPAPRTLADIDEVADANTDHPSAGEHADPVGVTEIRS